MLTVLYGFAFSFLTALVVLVGDYVIKLAVVEHQGLASRRVVLGCLLYGGSALLWFGAMRHATLAQAGVAFSMFSLIALCVMGAVLFEEPIRTREATGIAFALFAMVLMTRVA